MYMCGMCYLCVVCWELLGGVYVCGIYVSSLHNLSSMYVVHGICGMSVFIACMVNVYVLCVVR